jgi:hypothetical protein
VRLVEDITEALWGSPSTVSALKKKIYGTIEAWRATRRSWAGEVRNVSLLVAIGMNESVLSEDSRHLRGGEGGQDWLEGVPQASQGTRVEGYAHR